MKKTFIKLATVVAATACVFASCQKQNPDNNGGIKDPDDNDNENTELPASLKGSAYVPVVIDAETAKSIEKKIVADLRTDDYNNFLYVWENTYVGGEGAGLNFYEGTGYTSLVVGKVGWSGAGFCHPKEAEVEQDGEKVKVVIPAVKPFVNNDLKDWYFHLAYKTNDASATHRIQILWGIENESTTEYAFALGGDFNDNGTITKVVDPISNDGKVVANVWNEYEIPLSQMGIDFSKELTGNYITVLSGGVEGTQLNLDAVFFYKK